MSPTEIDLLAIFGGSAAFGLYAFVGSRIEAWRKRKSLLRTLRYGATATRYKP